MTDRTLTDDREEPGDDDTLSDRDRERLIEEYTQEAMDHGLCLILHRTADGKLLYVDEKPMEMSG